MKFLQQLLRIVAGFIAATFVAVISGMLMVRLLPLPEGVIPPEFSLRDTIDFSIFYWFVVVVLSAIPVFIAAAIAEAIKLRSLIAHAVIGAVIGFFFTGRATDISSWLDFSGGPAQDFGVSAVMVIAGALGAAVYWVVAGKHAGKWREA